MIVAAHMCSHDKGKTGIINDEIDYENYFDTKGKC